MSLLDADDSYPVRIPLPAAAFSGITLRLSLGGWSLAAMDEGPSVWRERRAPGKNRLAVRFLATASALARRVPSLRLICSSCRVSSQLHPRGRPSSSAQLIVRNSSLDNLLASMDVSCCCPKSFHGSMFTPFSSSYPGLILGRLSINPMFTLVNRLIHLLCPSKMRNEHPS